MELHMEFHMELHMEVHMELHMELHMGLHMELHMEPEMELHMELHVELHMELHPPYGALIAAPYIRVAAPRHGTAPDTDKISIMPEDRHEQGGMDYTTTTRLARHG